ncbi:MAG: MaoC/PaaZ C-terminal domain-containing protein [Acidimicrobiales bacterium]
MKQITQDEYRSRLFDDLVVGERFQSRWMLVSAEEILEFSEKYDRQFFHLDEEAAESSRFGGLVASGAQTFAVWNVLNLEANGDIAWIAGVGFEKFRFPNPLRPGVEFQSRSELVTARVSKSDESRGVVTHLCELWTREDQCLFTAEVTALVERVD